MGASQFLLFPNAPGRKPFYGFCISSHLRWAAGTQHPQHLALCSDICQISSCPFRRGNETSWAALILTCPPKRGFFLHFWAKTQRREWRYEREPKQQKRKKEGKPKLKDGIAQKSQRKCKDESFHTGLKQKKGRCLEGYGTTDNFTNNCEEMSRGKPWLPLTPAWAAKRGKWLLLPSWS